MVGPVEHDKRLAALGNSGRKVCYRKGGSSRLSWPGCRRAGRRTDRTEQVEVVVPEVAGIARERSHWRPIPERHALLPPHDSEIEVGPMFVASENESLE